MSKHVVLALICFSLHAQDVFTESATKRYAEHLMRAGQFKLAQAEYDRLVFMTPTDDTLKANLLKAFRMAEDLDLGLQKAASWPVLNRLVSIEYGKLLLAKGRFTDAQKLWENQADLQPTDQKIFVSTAMVLQDRWAEALKLVDADTTQSLRGIKAILDQRNTDAFKSPAGAGLLSSLVPGLGRVYTRDWKDGLISLFFVGSNAFQAYRGFNAKGTQSVRGWIYSGLGLGFYLGNIYGSVQSAKRYNTKKNHQYKLGIVEIFNGDFK